MEIRSEQTPFSFQLDRDRLMALAEDRREAYASASPYPHTVMDEFLPEEVLDAVLQEFPSPGQVDWLAFDSASERKLASNDETAMGPMTRQLLAALNSSAFIDF